MATTIKEATKTVQLGDLELDLKLGGREIFKIERRLGKSMLSPLHGFARWQQIASS